VTGRMPADVADRLYGRLRDELGCGPAVLDVGVGSGAVSAELADRGVTLVLLDVVDLRGSEAPAAPFLRGSCCALPIRSGSVTGVHLARVLHHVPDWRRALAEVVRVLAPGGALCLTLGGRSYGAELSQLREAVFSAGAVLGLRAAHHSHQPHGADAVDAELAGLGMGTPELVDVSFPVWHTPRDAAADAAVHPYIWAPGQDLSPLVGVVERVLVESPLPPDEPIRHERVVCYRIYRAHRGDL